MAMTVEETDSQILRLLRDIRAKQDEHSEKFAEHGRRFDTLEARLKYMTRVLRYAMGQDEETAFRQAEQGREIERQRHRTDEPFNKLEELLSRA